MVVSVVYYHQSGDNFGLGSKHPSSGTSSKTSVACVGQAPDWAGATPPTTSRIVASERHVGQSSRWRPFREDVRRVPRLRRRRHRRSVRFRRFQLPASPNRPWTWRRRHLADAVFDDVSVSRLACLTDLCHLKNESSETSQTCKIMTENVVSTFSLPFGAGQSPDPWAAWLELASGDQSLTRNRTLEPVEILRSGQIRCLPKWAATQPTGELKVRSLVEGCENDFRR